MGKYYIGLKDSLARVFPGCLSHDDVRELSGGRAVIEFKANTYINMSEYNRLAENGITELTQEEAIRALRSDAPADDGEFSGTKKHTRPGRKGTRDASEALPDQGS